MGKVVLIYLSYFLILIWYSLETTEEDLKRKKRVAIVFKRKNIYYIYYIERIDNDVIGLNITNNLQEDESRCFGWQTVNK